MLKQFVLLFATWFVRLSMASPDEDDDSSIRVATFNLSLNRFNAGDLQAELCDPTVDSVQARVNAEIVQRVQPDVLLLNEFDYDVDGAALACFQDYYLAVSQNGANPITFGYSFVAPSNTGIPSGVDLDNSGSVGGPNDAFGFGFFPGQFAMAFLSKYPIGNFRTFQTFRWVDMPGALLPENPDGTSYYSEASLDVFRLSSKSHWDLPVQVGENKEIHILASHPTPPVFDGAEDRNGKRNHDEIRFWADYIDNADYIYDDDGVYGGLKRGSRFIVAGDQNADPFDGDSFPGAAQLLLENNRINTKLTPSSQGAVEQAALQGQANDAHLGDPQFDTADFADGAPGNLRVDYVLPSKNLRLVNANVFWPLQDDPLFALVGTFPFPSSDHRLVYIDIGNGDED